MPGRRLVDGEDLQSARVVLAKHRGDLLIGPVLARRGDREEAVEPLVERAGWDEHRAAEGAKERRGPDDLERLVGKADEVAFLDEGLDALVLVTTEVEELVRPRVILTDGIQHPARQGIRVFGHRLVADPGRPQLAGEAQHLATDIVVGSDGACLQLLGRDRRFERVMELAVIQVRPEAEAAVGGGQELVAQPDGERVDSGDGSIRRACHTRAQLLVDICRHGDRRAAQVRDAGNRLDRLLDVEARHGAAAAGRQVGACGLENWRDAFHAAGCTAEPIRKRRELPAQQGEQAAAEQVAVRDRAP